MFATFVNERHFLVTSLTLEYKCEDEEEHFSFSSLHHHLYLLRYSMVPKIAKKYQLLWLWTVSCLFSKQWGVDK